MSFKKLILVTGNSIGLFRFQGAEDQRAYIARLKTSDFYVVYIGNRNFESDLNDELETQEVYGPCKDQLKVK